MTNIKKSKLIKHKDPVVFISKNGVFENRADGKFGWIFKSFGIGAFIWLVMVLIPGLKENELKKLRSGKYKQRNELKEILWLLIPKREYYVTPIIINLNLAIFLIMMFSGLGVISFKAIDLLNWGGNFRPSVLNGEWWRLLTNVFLHGGIMHIIVNMASLLFAGIFLEPVLGAKRFTLFYLLTGVLASIASIWWHERTVSVGASGAIFGMYSISLALLLMKVFPKGIGRVFLISTVVFVSYNLLIGLRGGIDNAAHIGGVVSGFVTGLIIARSLKQEQATEPTPV